MKISEFKKNLETSVYFYDHHLKDSVIEKSFNEYNDSINRIKKEFKKIIDTTSLAFNEDQNDNILENAINSSFNAFLDDQFLNKKISEHGYCLKKNLIGKACYMKHNPKMLGVVNDTTDNPRFLIVDFADPELHKIDIDELYISGQKK